MKIGIITQYYNSKNYGGNLQAFALQKKISEMGFDCEQITYDRQYKGYLYCLLRKIKHSRLKELPHKLMTLIKYILKSAVLFKDLLKIKKRNKVFSAFSESIPHSRQIYRIDDVKALNDNYDAFVVGSDCVWNLYEDNFVTGLAFADKGKLKISYAASLGCLHLPDGWAEKYIDKIKGFNSLSVREKTVADDIRYLLPERKISVTADPVLLFTAEEWNSLLPTYTKREKYALIYILSEDRSQFCAAEKWAHSVGLKVLTFPHIHNIFRYWQKGFGDIREFCCNPLEFVSLIKNAEIIITDSFHASIFSALFHKPFYALARDSEKEYMGRVENFLDDTGLSAQLVNTDKLLSVTDLPLIDFSEADRIIEEKRKESIQFLKDSLK